ncbi:aldehyde dehydrogenase [Rhodococcoides fascians]|uniref:aldehyde dehydrogenase n=2 Tax=Nocardiaceae TaxID=85025 RepID=UPI000522F284|nr:aldehyde dehydrogenase [Rhodococcus fascians]
MKLMDVSTLWIGGSWEEPHGATSAELVDPAKGEVFATVAIGSSADVPGAVTAARAALPPWRASTREERADLLDRIADEWERAGDEIASIVSREIGMPAGWSHFNNVAGPVMFLRYYANVARGWEQETVRPGGAFDGSIVVRKNPVGVVGAIAPWNYPNMLLISKIAPALAAGCVVIAKPARENALSAHRIAQAFEAAGTPAGVVNIIPGGREFASALVAHPGVDKIAFTGSTAVGKDIGATVGGRLGVANLELGGKSAAIVLDDADLAHTLTNLPPLSFMNTGQTCFAQTRIIATPGVYDAIVAGFTRFAEEQVVGDPNEPTTTMGPVASARQRESVLAFIEKGIQSGARLVAGGTASPVDLPGYYVAPTVFADVDNTSEIAQREIFGPVICIIRARDEEHALALANDSEFGLAGSIWTTDTARALTLARRFESGSVGINGYVPDIAAPWGGVKGSGTGRENGPEAVDAFTHTEAIYQFA